MHQLGLGSRVSGWCFEIQVLGCRVKGAEDAGARALGRLAEQTWSKCMFGLRAMLVQSYSTGKSFSTRVERTEDSGFGALG